MAQVRGDGPIGVGWNKTRIAELTADQRLTGTGGRLHGLIDLWLRAARAAGNMVRGVWREKARRRLQQFPPPASRAGGAGRGAAAEEAHCLEEIARSGGRGCRRADRARDVVILARASRSLAASTRSGRSALSG